MTLHVGGAISMEQIRVENQVGHPVSLYDHRRGGYTSLNNTGWSAAGIPGVPDSHVGLALSHFYGLHKVVDGMAEWGGIGTWAFTVPQHGYVEFLTVGGGGGGAVGDYGGPADAGGAGGASTVSGSFIGWNGEGNYFVLTASGGYAGSGGGRGGQENWDSLGISGLQNMTRTVGGAGQDGVEQGRGGRGGHSTYYPGFPYGSEARIGNGGNYATTGTGGTGGNWGAGGGGTRGGGGGGGAQAVQGWTAGNLYYGFEAYRYSKPFAVTVVNGRNGPYGDTARANAGPGGAAYNRVIWKAVRPW